MDFAAKEDLELVLAEPRLRATRTRDGAHLHQQAPPHKLLAQVTNDKASPQSTDYALL
jgi:hypothetical protein